MNEYSLIVCEIGVRGDLTPGRARQSAAQWLATAALTTAPLAFTVGGFDEDPRELVDIPEAVQFVRQWYDEWKGSPMAQAIVNRVHRDSMPILMLAAGVIRRDQIQITGWQGEPLNTTQH